MSMSIDAPEPAAGRRRLAGAITLLAMAGYLLLAAAAPQAHAASAPAGSLRATAPATSAAADAPSALGGLLHNWVTALLLGIAGLVGIAHVAKRDIGKAVELGLVVLLVGGFAFAPDTIKGVVQTFWQTVFGG
jgi:hypothetical protein